MWKECLHAIDEPFGCISFRRKCSPSDGCSVNPLRIANLNFNESLVTVVHNKGFQIICSSEYFWRSTQPKCTITKVFDCKNARPKCLSAQLMSREILTATSWALLHLRICCCISACEKVHVQKCKKRPRACTEHILRAGMQCFRQKASCADLQLKSKCTYLFNIFEIEMHV